MGSLEIHEQDSALLEVNLLKALNHPNIVSYKTSFILQGMLIIIMEYCEVGDLSFHIKRKLQKNESFTETEIFNWFVQLCLALEYIHGRKVLHRDLKTQNIFLTGNNTVKLGDFGISKVLENTNCPVGTVVGTPYYMSPEMCQNQPYTFKSDVWALGCVLYELCTLKHAFSADNLLGLVYKIVQDKYEPIPSHYSENLSCLIYALLNKNAQERPSVAQILQMPIIKQKMIEFLNSGGITIGQNKQVFVRNAPQLVHAPTNDTKNKGAGNLTPIQRMKQRKEEEVRKKQEELAAHSKKAIDNYQYAKEMQYNQLYSSVKDQKRGSAVLPNKALSTLQLEQTAIHLPSQNQMIQKQNYPSSFEIAPISKSEIFEVTEFGANDRDCDFTKTDFGTQFSKQTMPETPSKFANPYNSYEDRVITAKGNYDLSQVKSDFYDIEEDFSEVVEAKEDKQELKQLMQIYQRILTGIINDSEAVVKQSFKHQNEMLQRQVTVKDQIVGNNKQKIFNALGEELFQKVYQFLKNNRRKGTDEAVIHQELKRMVKGDRQLMNHCFNLDGLVFMELLKEQ